LCSNAFYTPALKTVVTGPVVSPGISAVLAFKLVGVRFATLPFLHERYRDDCWDIIANQNCTKGLVRAPQVKLACELGNAAMEHAPTKGETYDVSDKFLRISAEDRYQAFSEVRLQLLRPTNPSAV